MLLVAGALIGDLDTISPLDPAFTYLYFVKKFGKHSEQTEKDLG